jgi:hypothetical protein
VSAPRRFRILRERSRKELHALEAETHTDAATRVSNELYGRTMAMRMTSWGGRDGVFAAIDDKTGEEKERFFVEAEDGTGKIVQMPSYPPSMTFEDAKKLAVKTPPSMKKKAKKGKRR